VQRPPPGENLRRTNEVSAVLDGAQLGDRRNTRRWSARYYRSI